MLHVLQSHANTIVSDGHKLVIVTIGGEPDFHRLVAANPLGGSLTIGDVLPDGGVVLCIHS